MSLLLVLCLFGHQAAPTPPLPLELQARACADRERAFAHRAQEIGPRLAFLEFFSPRAVLFTPFPTPARERLEQEVPWPLSLAWWPLEVTLSGDGQLACSTGPVVRTPVNQDPISYGTYCSIWQKNAEEVWEVIADLGTTTPALWAPQNAPLRLHLPQEQRKEGGCGEPLASCLERFHQASGSDLKTALSRFCHPGCRLLLPNTMPLSTPRERQDHLQTPTATWTVTGHVESRSQDLAATWGRGQGGYLKGEHGFLHLWQRSPSGPWQLCLQAMVGP